MVGDRALDKGRTIAQRATDHAHAQGELHCQKEARAVEFPCPGLEIGVAQPQQREIAWPRDSAGA